VTKIAFLRRQKLTAPTFTNPPPGANLAFFLCCIQHMEVNLTAWTALATFLPLLKTSSKWFVVFQSL
jgi:hypothetical protein